MPHFYFDNTNFVMSTCIYIIGEFIFICFFFFKERFSLVLESKLPFENVYILIKFFFYQK